MRNDWDFWVYPEASVPQAPEGVTVCTDWAAARSALAEGRRVVLFPNSHETLRGAFLPVFWSPIGRPNATPNTMGILCDPGHPLFSTFPTDGHSDWQWYDLMQNARLYNLEGTPSWYRPLLWVIDNFGRNQKLGVVFEGRVGEGQLLVCGFDLPAMAAGPAPRQLLSSLYRYVESPAFDPRHDVDEALISRLFDGRLDNNIRALGGTLRVSSVAGNSSVDFLTDGNPGSMWTPRRLEIVSGLDPEEAIASIADLSLILPASTQNETGSLE